LRTTFNRARKSKNSFYDDSVYDLSPTDAGVEGENVEDEEDDVEEHREPREKRRRKQADPPPSLTFQKEDDDDDDNDNVWRDDNLNHNPGLPSLDRPVDTTDTTNNSPVLRTYNPSKFNNVQRAFLQRLFVNYKAEIAGRVNHAFIKESLALHPHLFPQSFLDSLTREELSDIRHKLNCNPTAKRRSTQEEAKANKAAGRKVWRSENLEKCQLQRKSWKSRNREKMRAYKSASKRAKARAKYTDPNYIPRIPREADQLFAADRDIPWNSTSKALFAALDETSKDEYLTLAKEERDTWKLKKEERRRAEAAAIQG